MLPQMWVTQTGLIRSVKCPKFKDMLFLHSWEHVHVRLHSFNCFQMCALASQPFHFCLFPPLSLLSPAGFYLAPSSYLHPLIHILCVISFLYFGLGGWVPVALHLWHEPKLSCLCECLWAMAWYKHCRPLWHVEGVYSPWSDKASL